MSITSDMIMTLIEIVGEDEFYKELNNINAARARKYCKDKDKAKSFYHDYLTPDECNQLKQAYSRKEKENG